MGEIAELAACAAGVRVLHDTGGDIELIFLSMVGCENGLLGNVAHGPVLHDKPHPSLDAALLEIVGVPVLLVATHAITEIKNAEMKKRINVVI